MKNIFLVFLLSITMIFTMLPIEVSYAKEINSVSMEKRESISVISEELHGIILQKIISMPDEKISVSIEFDDGYNKEVIEKQAYERAGVKEGELLEKEQELIEVQDEMTRAGVSTLVVDQTNEKKQTQLLEEYDKVSGERIRLGRTHVQKATVDFINDTKIAIEDVDSMCSLIPLIPLAWLTPEQILELAVHPSVTHIEYVDVDQELQAFALGGKTIIGGDVATNSGYTGSNIRVGVIEYANPDLGVMGTDGNNIVLTSSSVTRSHATMVCGIIRKMVPEAIIYTRVVASVTDVIEAAEYLIETYDVHVINISYGVLSDDGKYSNLSRGLDELIERQRCTICIAAGNSDNINDSDIYINELGLAPNAITVGAVTRSGTDPDAEGAYSAASYSVYREYATVINKPDVCAPGTVSIYGYSDLGTSFSTPFVTGTVAQMMARNSGLRDKPETIKAALMASASRNGGTDMTYVQNSIGSNREGVGVIDADFCYQVAKNGRRTHIDVTSTGTHSINIYCDDTIHTFRVAAAWYVNSSEDAGTTYETDFDMRVYKNGTLVATSAAFVKSATYVNTNYEVVSIPPSVLQKYGAGYYEVRIVSSGQFFGPSPNRIGIAWEQTR